MCKSTCISLGIEILEQVLRDEKDPIYVRHRVGAQTLIWGSQTSGQRKVQVGGWETPPRLSFRKLPKQQFPLAPVTLLSSFCDFFSSLPSWDSHGRFKLSVLRSHLYTSTSHYIGNTKLYCRNCTVQLPPNSYLIKDKRLSTWSMMKMLKISDECSDIEGSWISLPLLKAQETSRRGRQKDPKSQRVEKMGRSARKCCPLDVTWLFHA